MVHMFLNGGGMRGGAVHHHIAGIAEFLGEVRTAPRYGFVSIRDEYPGLHPVDEGGVAVAGELYEVPMATLRDGLLPAEPPELELSIIELEDGSSSLAMVLRPGIREREEVTDISAHGGWRAYRGLSVPAPGTP